MTESQIVTLICEEVECQITLKVKAFDYYAENLKRITKYSNIYCLECYQKKKDNERRLIKETGKIKGFEAK